MANRFDKSMIMIDAGDVAWFKTPPARLIGVTNRPRQGSCSAGQRTRTCPAGSVQPYPEHRTQTRGAVQVHVRVHGVLNHTNGQSRSGLLTHRLPVLFTSSGRWSLVSLAADVARQCWGYGVVGVPDGLGGGGYWRRVIGDVACCLEPLASAIVVIGMWLGWAPSSSRMDRKRERGERARRGERMG